MMDSMEATVQKCWVCEQDVQTIWQWEGHPICPGCLREAPRSDPWRHKILRAIKRAAITADAAIVYPEVRLPDVEQIKADSYNEGVDDAIEEISNPSWRDAHDTNLRMADALRDLKK